MPVCDIQRLAWPNECVRTWFYLGMCIFPCDLVCQVYAVGEEGLGLWPASLATKNLQCHGTTCGVLQSAGGLYVS